MPFKKIVFLLVLFIPLFALAQNRQSLYGRVVSDDDPTVGLPNIYVINPKAGMEIKTNALGNFTIDAAPGDVLTVYSPSVKVREFTIRESSFAEQPFVISVEVTAYELEEVVIQDTINSVSLGIVSKNQKEYTPAEKRVFTATNGVDGIINAIRGRTKMLKKELEVEKKEQLMEKIGNLYTEEQLMAEFKIPEDKVRAFVFYVADDKKFAAALKEKNDVMAKFIMQGLAEEYLKIQAEND